MSYGGRYDFNLNRLVQAEPIASFLHPLRERVARWSGIPAAEFAQALINEYRPGTELGWHRDAPDFESVVGVSARGWPHETATLSTHNRPQHRNDGNGSGAEICIHSDGASRWKWQHAISPTKALPLLDHIPHFGDVTFASFKRQGRKPLTFSVAF